MRTRRTSGRVLSPLAALLVTSALVLSSVGLARADGPRVAVLPFEGAERIGARIAVQQALDDAGIDVTSLADSAEAARRAHVRGSTRPHIDRALELADADVTVQGRTAVEDGEVALRIVVRGSGGRSLLTRQVVLDGESGELAELAEAVRAAIRPSATTSLAARVASPVREEPEDEAPVSRRRREREETTEPASARGLPWLFASAGGSARMRDASFDTADGTRFHRAWYPSIDIAAELRPLHTATGTERGFFVRASFSHSVGLRSRTDNNQLVDTAFFNLAADMGLLVTIDPTWELGFGLGLGVDSFNIGVADAVVVPTAVYGNLRPGIRSRVHLLGEIVVLDLNVGYRWVFERGPISAAFGRGGESHGVDVGVQLGGAIDIGFSWAITAEVVTIVSQHHGEADVVAATGGRDIGLRFGARLGLALW